MESSLLTALLQVTHTSGAQRLAASMESSPVRIAATLSSAIAVLNALRHQWNLHDRAGVRLAEYRVLNALRHQWNLHPHAEAHASAGLMCSTPCGINGIFTQRPTQSPEAHAVLNALRHQWNLHHRDKALVLRNTKCSTPCGINGIFTTRMAHWVVRPRVLNALRHQWNLHPIRRLARARPTCSTPCGINGIFTAGRSSRIDAPA